MYDVQADPAPVRDAPAGTAFPPFPHTALTCLVVARHHGIQSSVERLVHQHAPGEAEPTVESLIRIANSIGLRARSQRLDLATLAAAAPALPVLARLHNGNWIAVAAVRREASDGTSTVTVIDPLATGGGMLALEGGRFAEAWDGTAVFVRRPSSLFAGDQEFGLGWFTARVLEQKTELADVAVAAVLLQVIALATPLYLQLVIDKVLVHQALVTLTVGIVVALLFESVFGLPP